ncbi:MAG TPA: enoyl-CoA hydratase-related protein [Opitutaceae bacterium]|nr:enoyl-CoA hydratase-related protein [Opitutaceae bacterium]
MSDQDILLVERGPVTVLTLNRPEKLNALNRALGLRLISTLMDVGFAPDVRVVVIKGTGRSFCAGDDVSGNRVPDPAYDRSDPVTAGRLGHYWQFQRTIRLVPRPVIAQVHGHCFGAGMDLALASDYAVASDTAKFSVVFIKRAIAAGTVMLPRHVGLKRATELLFEGDAFTAGEALELGLVTRVCPESELEASVMSLAEKLAAGPTRVVGFLKHGLNQAYFPGLEDELQDMAFLQQFATKTEDSAEARTAWQEGRKPVFVGR